jgi:hypothetical protein
VFEEEEEEVGQRVRHPSGASEAGSEISEGGTKRQRIKRLAR